MVFGLLGAIYKSAMMLKAAAVAPCAGCLVAATPAILCFGMVLWTSAKIYFAFQCDSHMWNLTSGCVHHADQ